MLLQVAALLLFFTGAQSTCYYEDQTYNQYTWPVIYIMNSYDDASGNPKAGTCQLSVHSNDSTLGFGGFTLSETTSANGWTVTVLDSQGSHKFSGRDGLDSSNFRSYITTSSNISITITTDNDSVQFLATMKALPIGQLIQTTTAPNIPSTTPYVPTNGVINNPALIAADIVFAIDSYKGTGSLTEDRKSTVFKILQSLSLTADPTNTVQSRVAIAALTAMPGTYGPYGQIWQMTSALDVRNQALNSIPKDLPSASFWKLSLQGISEHLFDIKSQSSPSRPRAQRVLTIVFTDQPNDADELVGNNFSELQASFNDKDVIPVFVMYKGNTNTDFYSKLSEKFVTISISDFSASSISSVLANSIDVGTKLCPPSEKLKRNPVTLTGSNIETYQVPENYQGVKDGDDQLLPWNTTPQQYRYCNFYDATYNFTTTNDFVCFKAFYELEVEKDFLRFYSGTTEIVSLSGMDTSGSVFAIPKPSETNKGDYWNAFARFTTNANQVYGGFQFIVFSSDDEKCTRPS